MGVSQVMVNLGIMVVGEWFVTDSIVAYCSHHWHNRYPNNIPRAWQRISKKKRWRMVMVLAAVMTSTVVLVNAPDELCYTGVGSGGEGVLGLCPKPPECVDEMSVFGPSHADEACR